MGWARWFGRRIGERVAAMDELMPRSASLDLAQTQQVSLFKITVAVTELPQGRFGGSCMKDIADFVKAVHVQLSHKRGDVGMLEILCKDL